MSGEQRIFKIKRGSWQLAWLRSQKNPWLFVTGVLGVLPVGAPNPDDLPQLDIWQDTALKIIAQDDRLSIRSGHGTGKTTFLAWLVLWFLLTHRDAKIPVAANSQDQLRDVIWPEVKKWWRRLPEALRKLVDVQAEKVVIATEPDAAFAVRRTASKDNTEALQGFHAKHMLFLIDEASGIPDTVFEVAMGALSTPGAKVVLAANPTRTSGFFYDTHHKLRGKWRTMVVNSENVPRATGHIEDVIAAYGKDSNKYRVRVLGEFPTADDDTVIALELVEAARNRQVDVLDHIPIWGVDVARFGDDENALCKRQGNHILEPIKTWRGVDTSVTLGKIAAEYAATPTEDRPKRIMVDSIGVGAGVVDMGRAQGLPIFGVNVAESASSDDKDFRLRDELWFKGRAWFEARDCHIPFDEALVGELTAPTFDFHSNGKRVVESKKDMKKRGIPSPNRADAFLLTFAAISEQRPKKKRGSRGGSGSSWVS